MFFCTVNWMPPVGPHLKKGTQHNVFTRAHTVAALKCALYPEYN